MTILTKKQFEKTPEDMTADKRSGTKENSPMDKKQDMKMMASIIAKKKMALNNGK
jgi:hypothetical protein